MPSPERCLSVIIPVLNEAKSLPLLLDDLSRQQQMDLDIVVVDGGSQDASPALAAQAGARVVHSKAGRGRQMNSGAAVARHPLLLFLHADTRLPDDDLLADAHDHFRSASTDQRRLAGHFSLRFGSGAESRLLYRYLEEKSALNRPHCFNGDQGLMIEREFLQVLGGFAEDLHFLEDQRIGQQIMQQGRWLTLPGKLQTDTRRFDQSGPRRQWLLMYLIMGAFGAPVPEFLQQAPALYRQQRATRELRMSPYFRCYAQIMIRRGWRESLRGWWGLGGFAAQHSWQLFFFCDVLLRPLSGSKGYPLQQFHDRWLGWLSRTPPIRLFAAALMFLLTFVLLWPLVEIGESLTRIRRTRTG